jgi:hypothetical protein
MESLSNPFVLIPFLLTLIVISLSVISIRIQKNNKLQRVALEQSKVRSSSEYAAIGVFFQGDKTLIKCPSCAELVNIEAKICKSCTSSVEAHSTEVQVKLKDLNQRIEELRISNEKERAENAKKSFKTLAIVIPSVIGLFLVITFISSTFFPSNMKQLAGNVQTAIDDCGFKDVTVVVYDDSDNSFVEYPSAFEADGKFKSSPTQAKCLKDSLDALYKEFNANNLNDGHTASYFIGNVQSGTWTNDYADAYETYTLEHNWYSFE